VLQEYAKAERIATSLGDHRLLANVCRMRSTYHMDRKHYDLARKDIRGALDCIDELGTPLKVEVCLVAANAHVVFTGNDASLENGVKGWLDTALNIVHKGKIEDDGSFLKTNLAAVHHEKAKTSIKFHTLHALNSQYLKDARNELELAWKALTPDLAEWRMYFFLTESRLFLAEHDIEGAAKAATSALKETRLRNAKQVEEQVLSLYHELKKAEEVNPYIDNLGVQLGLFS